MAEKILFNDDWLFHAGAVPCPVPASKGPIYMQSKTERMKWGPACKDYRAVADDYAAGAAYQPETWKKVSLPHDYIVEQVPNENENNALGYFQYIDAWYRKEFTLAEEDQDKRITLLFEGIATESIIYLNGCVLKHHFSGYDSFEVDITDAAKFKEKNVLAVFVSTQHHEGWWYEGGGIYRNVWLVKANRICVDLWGVFAAPEKLGEGRWRVKLETMVRNDTDNDAAVQVKSLFYDGDKKVAQVSSEIRLPYRSKGTVNDTVEFGHPHLWDIDDPHLFKVVTVLESDGCERDQTETRFGFREVVLDPEKGLFLNGRHIKIKGVCAHQDFGLTGKAVPDNIHRHKIALIKEMGANGYRCSHYPHSQSTMDALDEFGFLVMDETRWFDSSEEGMKALEMLVKRDRNHPSVLFWSLGNEEPHHLTEEGRRICKTMAARVRQLDPTRQITSAVSNDPAAATVFDELDAAGINYNLDQFERVHKKYPKKPVFSSECCATGTTRGWYHEDCEENAFLEAYDKDTNHWFLGRENTWKFIAERDWILGAFQWIAFEHRGECIWPRLCSQSGAIDLYLQKKDAFYQNQAHWIEDRPVLHLLPHWNFEGYEGEPVRVVAYTNCEEAELFLNSSSLGRVRVERYGHGEWMVPYEKGTLTAVAYQNGSEAVRETRETTGAPYALRLKAENTVEAANGKDVILLTCFCVDQQGREVPDAAPMVQFSSNQYGKIIGTGSDITDHIPPKEPQRKMRAGRILVAVKVGQKKGELKIRAEAGGMKKACITIALEEMRQAL